MSDIVCRVKLASEDFPKMTSLMSDIDGKGKNELIRMFMRLYLCGGSYPFDASITVEGDLSVRLSVTKSSHSDLYEHLCQFPPKFRAAEVIRMLLSIEKSRTALRFTEVETKAASIEVAEVEMVESEHSDSTEFGDVIINDSDLALAQHL